MFRGLRRIDVLKFQAGWGRFLARLLASTAAMVLVILWLSPADDAWQAWHWWQRGTQLAILVGGGLGAYIGCQYLMGMRPGDFSTQKSL